MLNKSICTLSNLHETEYGPKGFSASKPSNLALEATQPPVHWEPEVFSGDKEAGP